MDRQQGRVWREWLTNFLPPYLSRDPRATPAIRLQAPDLVSAQYGVWVPQSTQCAIRDHVLIIPEVGLYDLTRYQLDTLVAAINTTTWGATLSSGVPPTLGAQALLDTGESRASPTVWQDVRDNPYLTIATDVAWNWIRPVAATWDGLWADIVDFTIGELQGPWLDALGTYLQIPRVGGEPDTLYKTRLFGLAVTTNSNAVSMAGFFAALGYAASVQDTGPGAFAATFQWPTTPPAGFVYSQADLAAMVTRLKVAGVVASVVFAAALQDTLSMADSATTTTVTAGAQSWGGTLPDGTGYAAGAVWNQSSWS